MRILSAIPDSIPEAMRIIAGGGVVICPTETCYGISADLTNADAVRRVFALKQRPLMQPVSGLFATVADAKRFVEWNDAAERLATEELPGPLTLVLPLRSDAPTRLFPTPSGGFSLGVRVSSHLIASVLADACGVPLTTTSANIHGCPNPYNIDDLRAQFGEDADIVILDAGVLPPVQPSRVIDLTNGLQSVLRDR